METNELESVLLESALHEMKEHELLYFMAKILEELTRRSNENNK